MELEISETQLHVPDELQRTVGEQTAVQSITPLSVQVAGEVGLKEACLGPKGFSFVRNLAYESLYLLCSQFDQDLSVGQICDATRVYDSHCHGPSQAGPGGLFDPTGGNIHVCPCKLSATKPANLPVSYQALISQVAGIGGLLSFVSLSETSCQIFTVLNRQGDYLSRLDTSLGWGGLGLW